MKYKIFLTFAYNREFEFYEMQPILIETDIEISFKKIKEHFKDFHKNKMLGDIIPEIIKTPPSDFIVYQYTEDIKYLIVGSFIEI